MALDEPVACVGAAAAELRALKPCAERSAAVCASGESAFFSRWAAVDDFGVAGAGGDQVPLVGFGRVCA